MQPEELAVRFRMKLKSDMKALTRTPVERNNGIYRELVTMLSAIQRGYQDLSSVFGGALETR